MSWLRNWLNRAKEQANTDAEPGPRDGQQEAASGASEDHREGFHIRDAERRQLRRLLKREGDLEYDLQRAGEAFSEENQWTERIEQLNQAVEQAIADREAIEPKELPVHRPQLEPIPVEVTELKEAEPANITLKIGSTSIEYYEELDWAERGHQVTMPELNRVSGDVDGLMPELDDEKLAKELREHLRHSLAIYANQVLEHAANGEEPPPMTLAAMTQRCPDCGGWLDQKQRCPHCAELNWKRQELDNDLRRIRNERDDVIKDLERQQDRYPVIERQLKETRDDIAKLRAKGVEPA
jgi:hypothetical protein